MFPGGYRSEKLVENRLNWYQVFHINKVDVYLVPIQPSMLEIFS